MRREAINIGWDVTQSPSFLPWTPLPLDGRLVNSADT